jgi:FlaA1/EpsC-like NDP-sugar epimerase
MTAPPSPAPERNRIADRMQRMASSIILTIADTDRAHKQRIVIAADILTCALSVLLAFSLRVGALSFPVAHPLLVVLIAVSLYLPLFALSGIYQSIFRASGARSIAQLAWACGLFAVPMAALFLVIGVPGVPRTIGLLQPMIFFGLTASSRILIRHVMQEFVHGRAQGERAELVVIYGAGAAGQQLAVSLRHEPGYVLAGFVDDDAALTGRKIDGVPIVHASQLPALVARAGVGTVLLAMPGLGRRQRKAIIAAMCELGVRVQILPRMQEVMDGAVSVSDLRRIRIEDLLSRDLIPANELLLGRTVVGKVVMVSGAGGSIGSELCRQIAALRPRRLVLVEMSELALFQIERELREAMASGGIGAIELVAELANLTDRGATGRLLARHRPHTVIHAAAYKHVPLVEANMLAGLRNNVLGTLHAALAAQDAGVERFILVSTDKAVRPTNVMGASKRIGELILQGLARAETRTRFGMVRFGNVLGSSGSVVPQFERQIAAGGPVTITHRAMTRYFMTIREAAQLVIQAGSMVEGGEVYLLDMGAPVQIHELARTMIELSGLRVRDAACPEGDIAIAEIGLRPGEKLFEELLIDSTSEPTQHPRIFKARESGWD